MTTTQAPETGTATKAINTITSAAGTSFDLVWEHNYDTEADAFLLMQAGREVARYGSSFDAVEAVERGELEPLPVVASLGWVQEAPIPVAISEGAVVIDLSAFLLDLIRETRRHGFDTDLQVVDHLQAKGYATPHLSVGAAERLHADLGRAIPAAEEAGTITETARGN